MNVKYAYQRLLIPNLNSDSILEFDKEAWFSLLSQNNIDLENQVWEKGHSLLNPYSYKNEIQLHLREEYNFYSPLFLLFHLDENFVLKNMDVFSRWLEESVFQININEDNKEYIYDFFNKEQEIIFYKLINAGLKEQTYQWIKQSKLYPKPHIRLEEIDIRRVIFNHYSIKGLNVFSEDWGKNIWNKKWNFGKQNSDIAFLNEDLLVDPNSFWPIECGTLHIDWLQSLLDKNTPTGMLLIGLYNSKDIETIALRVLKIAVFAFNDDTLKNEDNEDIQIFKSNEFWLRREQHPLKSLKLLIENNAPIEGSWKENPWWKYWLKKRKEDSYSWKSWDKEILFYIDSLAEKKQMLLIPSQLKNEKNKKRI